MSGYARWSVRAHSVGIQRFQSFARLLFHSIYDYVCGAVRQSKALSFIGQVVPHRIKRSEVEGGEGHLSCVKNALMNHERALYNERLTCHDAMLAAHEEKQESKLQCSLEWARARMRRPRSLRVRWSTGPHMVMVESASGNALLLDEE